MTEEEEEAPVAGEEEVVKVKQEKVEEPEKAEKEEKSEKAEKAEKPEKVEKVKEPQKYKEERYDNPKCNMRIEELAKPNKMHVKIIYKEYKKILPERNVKAILLYLREEFAKSLEETELDFKDIEHKQKLKMCRSACRREARIKHLANFDKSRRRNMLKILTDIVRKYITRAYFNPKQIIMTSRLRRISNIILNELCKIRKIAVPSRESTKIRAYLMFSTADFFAYCIDTIYYEMQVMKIKDYEKLQQEKDNLTTPESNYKGTPDTSET